MLNTCPAVHDIKPQKLPADGFACKAAPGIFSYISHFLGVPEPQLRKALHFHCLLGVVGFSHPSQFFNMPGLEHRLRNAWLYVASTCFRSVEAYAAHMNTPQVAFEALRTAPLMPVKQEQHEKSVTTDRKCVKRPSSQLGTSKRRLQKRTCRR